MPHNLHDTAENKVLISWLESHSIQPLELEENRAVTAWSLTLQCRHTWKCYPYFSFCSDYLPFFNKLSVLPPTTCTSHHTCCNIVKLNFQFAQRRYLLLKEILNIWHLTVCFAPYNNYRFKSRSKPDSFNPFLLKTWLLLDYNTSKLYAWVFLLTFTYLT